MTDNCICGATPQSNWSPDFSLVHIGINAADTASAVSVAQTFSALFDFSIRETSISVFSGEIIEVMSGSGRGTHGHIGIGTHSMDDAIAWLRAKGVEFIEETLKKNDQGKYGAVYMKNEIGGFSVHLIEV